jgi:hypothetical protein
MISDAVAGYFEANDIPHYIRLHFVEDLVFACS